MSILKKIVSIVLVIIISVIVLILCLNNKETNSNSVLKVNLSTLTSGDDVKLKTYTIDNFNEFLSDYNSNNLDDLYVTEFLFDGVSMYRPYDLDDFIEEGNELEVEPLKITTLNINTTGSIELSGDLTGMIAINTNNVKKSINLILNGVNINTNSKKVPAIYVYNKDITYTSSKITIKTVENTKNYIEGGKLKKVSLIPSENLNDYSNNYTGENKTNYNSYTNYYGVYSSNELSNILFAKVKADSEDLKDGDPYYFYKASGAISSDIDLYFEGKGYLEIISKNKEGIETKGNLTFSGGTGDYLINAQDDCLNTTTSDSEISNARNTLIIDVNSLYAIVQNSADEGDAIDSNGTLTINGGLVVALSKTGQDSGIDSYKGIYINGGTIISTGDMYDQVSSESKQNFMLLSFSESVKVDDLVSLVNEKEEVIFSYKTDRSYTNLIYSSPKLSNGTYYLYKNGTIAGVENNGYYTNITSYDKGTQLGYSEKGNMMGLGDKGQNGFGPNNNMTPPQDGMNTPLDNKNMDRPNNVNNSANIKEFVIDGISNLFSGVGVLSE